MEELAKDQKTLGQAESQQIKLKGEAKARIDKSEEDLATAQVELREAKRMYVNLGPNNASLIAGPKAKVEHAELCIEHHEAVLALLDGPELGAAIERWDSQFDDPQSTHASLFVETIKPEIETVTEAAKAFAKALADMRRKYTESTMTCNAASELAKTLGEHGIRVKVRQPSLLVIQQSVALALRSALVGEGLGLREHWVEECLRPDHYTPPEAFKKERAA